jgi:hypothetical protein
VLFLPGGYCERPLSQSRPRFRSRACTDNRQFARTTAIVELLYCLRSVSNGSRAQSHQTIETSWVGFSFRVQSNLASLILTPFPRQTSEIELHYTLEQPLPVKYHFVRMCSGAVLGGIICCIVNKSNKAGQGPVRKIDQSLFTDVGRKRPE